MATLARYFGLGNQTHRYIKGIRLKNLIIYLKTIKILVCFNSLFLFRSLDDVRMNLEVLKYCATVLFLVCSVKSLY